MCITGMRLALLVAALLTVGAESRRVKKTQNEIVTPDKESELTTKTTGAKLFKLTPPRPILAIEIVDPGSNTSKSKNAKRTIDSSLGYGYQQNYYSATNRPPKYEVYKYSQHDIPAYRDPPYAGGRDQIHVQKSVAYEVERKRPVGYDTYTHADLSQHYQPGTTLFTTLNQQGQIDGLSQQAPEAHETAPVIYLKVFTNQLSSPGALHPNLPPSHPHASLNAVDLQSLLADYVKSLQVHQQGHAGYGQLQETQSYQQDYSGHQQAYQGQAQYQYQVQPAYQQQQSDGLLTHENYPSDAHTRVVFHRNKKAPRYNGPANTYLPVAQSYSNFQVGAPSQQYVYHAQAQEQSAPATQYVYSNAVQQDETGQYYYYVPGQAGQEDYSSQEVQDYSPQGVQHQTGGSNHNEGNRGPLVDTQTVAGEPYNYHAHRTRSLRSKKRNVVQRPAVKNVEEVGGKEEE